MDNQECLKPLPYVPGLITMKPTRTKRGYFVERARAGDPFAYAKLPLVLDWTVPGFEWESEDGDAKNEPPVTVDNETMLVNLITNMRMFGWKHDWSELWGSLKGKTAVVCAPGPSLRHHLPTVNQVLSTGRGDTCVFALNRAMRGVKGDYAIFLDRNYHPDIALQNGPDLVQDRLIAAHHSCPIIPAKFGPDNIYWGYTTLGSFRKHPACPQVAPFLSATCVGATAIFIVAMMKPEKILLLGYDGCGEGKMYLDQTIMTGPGRAEMREVLVRGHYYFDQMFDECAYVTMRSPFYQQDMCFPIIDLFGNERILFREGKVYIDTARAVASIVEHSMGIPVCNCTGSGIMDWHLSTLEKEIPWLAAQTTIAQKGIGKEGAEVPVALAPVTPVETGKDGVL